MGEDMKNESITVVGGGGWGTALAVHLAKKGYSVDLWVREPEVAAEIAERRTNSRFLPGVAIPPNVTADSDLGRVAKKEPCLIVMAVPTHGLRSVAVEMRGHFRYPLPVVVNVAKGLEVGSGMLPTAVLEEALGIAASGLCVLSGPSHAEEVGRGVPTAVVAASKRVEVAEKVQSVFFSPRFRVYSHDDVLGVELGGALKNIIAIACGIGDGIGFGDNTRAALMTRGLAEITRLGCALGARRETFWGLAGLGDLIVTCTSDLSRNRSLGKRIGQGESMQSIVSGMSQVAEGVRACQAAWQIARERGVAMPITEQAHGVLFENKSPSAALQDLLLREPRPEEDKN